MRTISKLISFLAGFQKMVVLAIILGWATTMSWIGLIATSSYLISYAALHPSIAELQVAIVGVRFFGLSRGVFRYLERLLSHSVTFKLLANLRIWFYQKIEPLAPAGLLDFQRGDLLSRIMEDVESLQEFYVRVLGPAIVALLSSLTVFWLFGQWSLKFALIISVFHLFVGVFIPLITQRVSKEATIRLVQNRSELSSVSVDILQGSAEIIAFNQESIFFQKAEDILQKEIKFERKINRVQAFSTGFVSFTVYFAAFMVLLIAIPLANSGTLDGKILAVVILGSIASFEAIMPLPQAIENLDQSLEAGRRLFEILDQEAEETKPRYKQRNIEKPVIQVKKLYFSYSQRMVLQDINFSLPFGKKIAIVGLSGSGKTTIANLLMGFWNFSRGEILLNGEDIRTLDQEFIRSLMAYVPQDIFIFNGTIGENIQLGKPSATAQEVQMAAKKAELHDFIESLPSGYQTNVGEKGAFLSGGQRQRISIARAALRDVPFFIYDEPFTNLDRITQIKVHQLMMECTQGRSLLLITHQLSGLSAMDEIIVMRNGRIIERGTEDDLLDLGGEYLKMQKIQQDFLLTQ